MDIRQLNYFVTLVEKNKFVAAAEVLHISQPSLSNMIKQLEKELGCKLFERSTREMKLTEPGEVLYRRAVLILKQFESTLKEMEDVKDTGFGAIDIAMIESSKYWIPKVAKQFSEEYSNVQIYFKEIRTKHMRDALISNDVHFAITTMVEDLEDTYELTPIYREELVLICPENHPFATKSSIDMANLEGETLILTQAVFQITEIIKQAIIQSGIDLEGKYYVERLDTARMLVAEGLGVCILPASYPKYSLHQGIHTVKLTNPTPKRKVFMAYNKERYYSPAVMRFRNLIQQFFIKEDNKIGFLK
ncbi:LysR family transcriptional regulator [Geomicrobium sediminis]|uniref:DNA-binding transcriptional LysR family regulator n=1 Tax=Geomicrobium sediminis TaxID=1347788 RepID=A0ABS2PC17_9BACL|nr:LysR family transcriptional regulator [Geomicrobium sediminis]MBM7632864.1 DNA-binding transcriptional LysR family regulator [Geomicrobium sediminis]